MWDPLTRRHHALSSEGEEEEGQGIDMGGFDSGPLSFLASDLMPTPPGL